MFTSGIDEMQTERFGGVSGHRSRRASQSRRDHRRGRCARRRRAERERLRPPAPGRLVSVRGHDPWFLCRRMFWLRPVHALQLHLWFPGMDAFVLPPVVAAIIVLAYGEFRLYRRLWPRARGQRVVKDRRTWR